MAKLIMTDCKKEEELLSEVEQDICRYIDNNKDENYDDVLAKESRWKVFYHLSEMRTSILNWYEFKENASILEIGGGFGAITGMLCRRAKRVSVTESILQRAEAIKTRYCNLNNLTVYAGQIEKMKFPEKFDYVIILGSEINGTNGISSEKQYELYVNIAKDWLKKDGTLLLALDNYNGAKYQCGYPRPALQSINENGCEVMMTKAQLEMMVSRAGFEHVKFYYPFPDYRLAQEIYTDARLPEGSVKDRILSYYVLPGMLYRDEYQIYESEINKGDIRNVCNSYLAECSQERIYSETAYVAVSTDRGKKHGFATVIDQNQVTKKAIYEEGKVYLKKSYDNILKIHSRGNGIVSHTYQDNKLIMPVMKGKKLVDWLFLLASESKEKFVYAIDKIYECILNSSDYAEKQGKIYLENGYIDMIPLNCFVDGGEYYFFDQEFCENECPIDYIMFRVLRYTYLTYPGLESYVRLEEMKDRYGLSEGWQDCLLKEDAFIWDNRQHRVNHGFYEWLENGRVAKPIASIEGICGLFLSEGFDIQEKDADNIWTWSVKDNARIYIRNLTDHKIRIRVQFMLYPPPGKQEQKIEIWSQDRKGNEFFAPGMIDLEEEITANELQFISFHVNGQLTKSDNGDPREFAFQLLNPQMLMN